MNKLILALMFIFSSYVHAQIPVTCVSDEKLGDVAVLKFKINAKVGKEDAFGKIWQQHLVGVTPGEGYKFITYGSGSVDDSRIGLTFVEKSFVLGKVVADFNPKKGYYIGVATHSKVHNGREYNIICADPKIVDTL